MEICLGGSWVSVCATCYHGDPYYCYIFGYGYTWHSSESAVVCRQLTGESYTCKLNLELATSQTESIVHNNEFCAFFYTVTTVIFRASFTRQIRSLGPPYFTDPSCSGMESQLLNCRHVTSSCSNGIAVGVRCYGKDHALMYTLAVMMGMH